MLVLFQEQAWKYLTKRIYSHIGKKLYPFLNEYLSPDNSSNCGFLYWIPNTSRYGTRTDGIVGHHFSYTCQYQKYRAKDRPCCKESALSLSFFCSPKSFPTRVTTAMDIWLLLCMVYVTLATFQYALLIAIRFNKGRKIREVDRMWDATNDKVEKCNKIDRVSLILFVGSYLVTVVMYFIFCLCHPDWIKSQSQWKRVDQGFFGLSVIVERNHWPH